MKLLKENLVFVWLGLGDFPNHELLVLETGPNRWKVRKGIELGTEQQQIL